MSDEEKQNHASAVSSWLFYACPLETPNQIQRNAQKWDLAHVFIVILSVAGWEKFDLTQKSTDFSVKYSIWVVGILPVLTIMPAYLFFAQCGDISQSARAFLGKRNNMNQGENSLAQAQDWYVCGLVVQVNPHKIAQIQTALLATPHTEIPAVDAEKGKLVVVMQAPDPHQLLAQMEAARLLEGVITVSLVYHQQDNDNNIGGNNGVR